MMSKLEYARPIHRVCAGIFDFLLAVSSALILLIPAIIIAVYYATNRLPIDSVLLLVLAFLGGSLAIIAIIIYLILVPFLWNGQTIGMRLFGIKIVSNDGSKLTLQSICLRELLRIIFVLFTLGVSLIVDLFIISLGRLKLSYYDVVAMTAVIDVF